MDAINNINPLGAAGVAGALVYAGLAFRVKPDDVLLIQLFMPAVMLVTYLLVLGKPRSIIPSSTEEKGTIQGDDKDGEKATDDSKPLLGSAEEEEEGEREDEVKVKSKCCKLRFFNKEEKGTY